MRVLAIDSSGIVASVAIVEEERVVAEFSSNDKITHSQTMLSMIDSMKKLLSIDLNSIEAIVVARGPGSFTGLRIGVSTAKALAMALNKKLVAVPTVDAIAYQIFDSDALICPMMDARRNQVYTGLYHMRNSELEIVEAQCAMDVAELIKKINARNERVIFLGDGIPVYEEYIKENVKVDFCIAPAFVSRQRAAALGILGIRYANEGKYEDADDFRPEYLRASQAERERELFLKKVLIEEMNEADVEQVAALEERTFNQPWSKKALRDSLSLRDYRFFVARMENKVVAYCGYYRTTDEANITNLIVSEEVRAKGIGHALMSHLMKSAYDEGINAITLEVRVSNMSARNLYESLGFNLEALRKNFYSAPAEDACIYWHRL